MTLSLDEHPLLEVAVFTTHFPMPIGQLPPAPWLTELLRLDAEAPLMSSDPIRAAVRDLLRWGGFKPTGRSKPASEFLIKAASEGILNPINMAADCCNVVSLHSGLPIGVVDLGRATGPFRVVIAPPGANYVFNASGQVIDLAGLICLQDQEGYCANPVRDAQRTKTHDGTTDTLTIIWGTRALPGRAAKTATWYRELLGKLGATTEDVALIS